MLKAHPSCLAVALFVAISASRCTAAEVTVAKSDRGAVVKIDGKLFTHYLVRSGPKPILWPIIGTTGEEMTRRYPMDKKKTPGERQDHIHHRSFWFTHGDVNGISFWHESKGHGSIVHRKFVKVASGSPAVIITENDWNNAAGKKVCSDVRSLRFGADAGKRWIDFDITITASAGDVKFGDTKEGCFGIRTAGTMKVDSKLGGKVVNSEGQTNSGAWGKPAAWVDYHGPVAGKRVGIAILNHPSSFRYPTHWHVRTYGLFAANPFGLHHFKGTSKVDGSHTLSKGKSFMLRYRVLFHEGDEKQANIAAEFEKYAKLKATN